MKKATETNAFATKLGESSAEIGQVNDISGTIATAMEEQWATSSEMSRNISEAAKGASKLTQNIQGVARAAQSTSQGAMDSQKAAKSLAAMATQLQALVGRFKLSTGGRSALTARAGKTNRNSGRAKKAEKYRRAGCRIAAPPTNSQALKHLL